MNIPFVDLKVQYLNIKEEIDSAISSVIYNADFIQGEDVINFEKEFSRYLNARFCISVNSGTDALILGIRALGFESGDEIIVPANTYISTALAVSENNLKPVFVDVDENDFGVNLDDLRKKINNKTKAIIVVHLFGQPDKIDEIQKIIKDSGKKIYLIEDACQAHGAEYKGKKAGTFGMLSAFSFYPGKNLGAYGDGGAIVTSKVELEKRIKLLREYGQVKKYSHKIIGVNSRLDTIQAAVLRVKLNYLNEWNKKRRELATQYDHLLKEIPFVITPRRFKERESAFHIYVVRTPKRNGLLHYLKQNKINALIHYPFPLHLQPAFKYLGYRKEDLPISEQLSSEILSLPIYPDLSQEMVEFVVDKIKDYFKY